MGIFEIQGIQNAFVRHYGVADPTQLQVPDGDYIVPFFDIDFDVRIKAGRIYLEPEGFDREKATLIDG